MFPRRLPCISLALICIVGMGCGSSKEETPVPVAGTIKVEDVALTVGWVTFHPDESRGNTSPRLPIAEIKGDGSYELSTNGKPGATCGHYKVVIAASKDPIPLKPPRNPDGTPRGLRWLVNEKYTRPDTTDLLIEVVEHPEPGRYDLKLSR